MIIFLSALIILLILILLSYNNLSRLRNGSIEAKKNINIFLKKRFDLVKNLESTVKGFAAHERKIHLEVTKLRNSVNFGDSRSTDTHATLTKNMRSLFAVIESYPDLKSNKNFLDFQRTLVTLENEIERARRYFNAYVRKINNAIDVFPQNLVAKFFRFKKIEFLEFDFRSSS